MNDGRGADPDARFDDVDEELLAVLRSCYDAADPMPAELVERTVFALALTDLDHGPVRLAEQQSLETVGARGEEARVITFGGGHLTVMTRISPQRGAVRVDGWLAPPTAALVELRMTHETVTVRADGDGRFVFEGVPSGLAQFVVRTGGGESGGGRDGDGGEETTTTPAIVL